MFTIVLLSCLALFVGPLIYIYGKGHSAIMGALDGFVVISIGTIVFLHVIPEAIAYAGWYAIVVALFGLLLPSITEKLSHDATHGTHRVALALATLALLIHAFLDGASMGTQANTVQPWLLAGIILHRLPVGMAIWVLIRPEWGKRLGVGAILLLILATVMGAWVAASTPVFEQGVSLALFQAFVAGSLLHVLFHQHGSEGHHHSEGHECREAPHVHEKSDSLKRRSKAGGKPRFFPQLVGAVVGALLVLGLEMIAHRTAEGGEGHAHEHAAHGFDIRSLMEPVGDWLMIVAPLYIVGLLLSVLFREVLQRYASGSRFHSVFGLLSETDCTCGPTKRYAYLLAHQVQNPEGVLFVSMMVSGPAVALWLGLLQWPVALMFMGAICGAFVLLGAVSRCFDDVQLVDVGRDSGLAHSFPAHSGGKVTMWWPRISFDRDAPWLVLSVVCGAALTVYGLGPMEEADPVVQFLVCIAIAAPLSIPIAPATVIAVAMIVAGLSPGAGLAFMAVGGGVNLRAYWNIVKSGGYRRMFLWAGGIVMVLLFCVALLYESGFMGDIRGMVHSGSGYRHGDMFSSWSVAEVLRGLLVLVFLFGLSESFLRRGPREWFTTMLNGSHS